MAVKQRHARMPAMMPRARSLEAAPDIRLIGAACGRGARDARCAEGPLALQQGDLVNRLYEHGIRATWRTILKPGHDSGCTDLEVVTDLNDSLARIVEAEVAHRHFFSVIGGDHSCAVGTWSGAARALHSHGTPGLIWIDAHMDGHTPETSPSGALHGMPLACLLGYGPAMLTGQAGGRAEIPPGRVFLLGVRSYEAGEKALLDRLGVRVCHMTEIRQRGLKAVIHEAIRLVTGKTAGFGISIDLDGIDPRDAPGVGSPVPDGIRRVELLPSLRRLSAQDGLIGIEIAEFNPGLDRRRKTARLIIDILTAITPGERRT